MSYEYKLIFDDASAAQEVIATLQTSKACVATQGRHVDLKDHALNSQADYDVRLTAEDEGSIWLAVNFKSLNLYRLVREALSGRGFRCFEDGDPDDEVELKEVFRIKGDS